MRLRTTILALGLHAAALSIAGAGGCASEGNGSVPSSAMLAAEGNRRLPYTTTAPGTLYVYDRSASQLIYCGEMDAGRQIVVDPDANRISVDGDVLQDKKLTSGHTYRIFFQPRGVR